MALLTHFQIYGVDGTLKNVQSSLGSWHWQLTSQEMHLLQLYAQQVESWGFSFKIPPSYCEHDLQVPVVMTKLPVVLGVELTCEDLRDFLSALHRTGGAAMTKPPCVPGILASKACRGAIMFGDRLTKEECSDFIYRLASCKLPFQCAQYIFLIRNSSHYHIVDE